MPIPDDIREELEAVRQQFLELLVPLQTPEDEGGDTPSDTARLRLALWTAVQAIDPLLAEAQSPPDVDLAREDVDTRQILRDAVVREYFSLRLLEDPGDVHVPTHTPEACDLRISFLYGRWLVTWLKLEGAPGTEREVRVLLVVDKDQEGRLVFTEV